MSDRGRDALDALLAADPTQLPSVVLTLIRRTAFELIRGIEITELREMLQLGVARAQANHVIGIKNQTLFVRLMFELGPDFHREPEIQQALTELARTPDMTIEDLIERIPDSVWDALQIDGNHEARNIANWRSDRR